MAPPLHESTAAGGEDPIPGSGRGMLNDRERARIWEQAIAAAARATRQVIAAAFTDPAAAGDAAWAAADFLTAAARVVEGRLRGPLTAAADEYDRAARELFGRHPHPRHAGHELRRASRLLLTARASPAATPVSCSSFWPGWSPSLRPSPAYATPSTGPPRRPPPAAPPNSCATAASCMPAPPRPPRYDAVPPRSTP